MKKPVSTLAVVLILAAVAGGFSSCRENVVINDNLGTIDVLSLPDTMTILSKTVMDDSIVTSLTKINTGTSTVTLAVRHGLGTLNDPFFGRTNMGIFFQAVPEKVNYTFSANAYEIDSAFIILPFEGFKWGDTTANAPTQNFTAYRVLDDLSKDATYFSFDNKNVDYSSPISYTTTISPYNLRLNSSADSPTVLGVKRAPHLRIPLKPEFINTLKTEAANASTIAAFLGSIKGLYVESTTPSTNTERTLSYFKINGTGDYQHAAIQFIFHETGSSNQQSAFFNFTDECAHFNRVVRTYNGNPADGYFKSTQVSDSLVLLQNEPGAAIDLRFPHLKNLPQGIINKAQLVLTQVTLSGDDEKTFSTPEGIYPVGIDGTGKSYPLMDLQPLGDAAPTAFVDGKRKIITLPNGIQISRYTLNIPRTIQNAIVNKTEELHLRINGTQTYPAAFRLIAGGGKHSAYKISLNISYSQIK